MDRSSVRLRLLVAAGIAIVLALAVSGWGLELLFKRHVERRAADELKVDMRALLAGIQVDDNGNLTLFRRPTDQRYAQAFSGLYWQISANGRVAEKSRSLWDEELTLPKDVLAPGSYHRHEIAGPRQHPLLAVEQAVAVKRGNRDFVFRATLAVDAGELALAVKAFRADLALGLGALAVALLATFWAALGVGLSPLDRLRNALGRLRAGSAARLAGEYPSEVQPLVDDLNEMLERQEDMVAKAQARAANLAHGLKTPLTAISAMAEELDQRRGQDIARELQAHATVMQRHIEHELAIARSVHGQISARTVLLQTFVDRLVGTMQRLPRGRDLRWDVDIDPAISLTIDETTLGEIVGNILDNARKHARSNVRIAAASQRDCIDLNISDDGAGVHPADRKSIVDRGKRLDETHAGSGLGLSIVSDIVEQLGGLVELETSDLGGLSVRIRLPSKAQLRLG